METLVQNLRARAGLSQSKRIYSGLTIAEVSEHGKPKFSGTKDLVKGG